jgi:hypothetical protein
VSLPGAWETRTLHDEPSLEILPVDARAIQDSWSGFEAVGWEGTIDGAQLVVERGAAGDHRFVHGAPPDPNGVPAAQTRAIHHLNAEASALRCAPSNPAELSWWRVVLDSVLFTVALLRGYEALHAGAIATPDGAIAIAAATGGGKSTLLTALLEGGAELMTDDVLVLEPRGTQLPVAHPGPPLMTVPATALSALDGTSAPQTIVAIEDERWVAVPVHPAPLGLKALVVLDRRPAAAQLAGARVSLTRIESPLAPLLGSLMRFPDSPERELRRFELASSIAAGAELWRLAADLETPALVLADTLMTGKL